jgi:hypothetical protein
MGWTLRPTAPAPPAGSDISERRSVWQRGWDAFDRLNNLQTAGVLSAGLAVLLLVAIGLLAASAHAPARSPVAAAGAVPIASARPVAPTQPPAATEAPRPHVLPTGINLRAEPTTRAPLLSTLPAGTEVFLTGERTQGDGDAWQRVRTADGREGWIIATAVD